jgi:hypothetical protein
LEFIKVPVQVVANGLSYDPHLDTVVMAFPARGVDPAVWIQSAWESDGAGGWQARCLVGPGGTIQLAAGTYDVWVKITDNPEVPVLKSGLLEVT